MQLGSSFAMSLPQVWLVATTGVHDSPPSVLRLNAPLDQAEAKAAVFLSRLDDSVGISEAPVMGAKVGTKVWPPSFERRMRPTPELVMPSPTRITPLSLSATTTMSHGLVKLNEP